MRQRAVMTLLLFVTLFTDFDAHKVNAIRSWESQKTFSSKRRILERLLKLGFISTEHETKNTHSVFAQKTSNATSPHSKTSFHKWYQSNQLPDKEHQDGDILLLYPIEETNPSSSPVKKNDFERNIFDPSLEGAKDHSGLDLLLEHYALSKTEVEDSLLYRRHALSPKRQDGRRTRKEKKEKRSEKKRKRRQRKMRKRLGKRISEFIDKEEASLHNIDGEEFFDCCPSNLVVVQKQVGKDRNNHAVEIRSTQQIFYERICQEEVEGDKCVFPDRALRKSVVTRCAQQFSYIQTQVRPFRSDQDWHLDYIQTRSGCSCQVSVSPRRRRKKKTS